MERQLNLSQMNSLKIKSLFTLLLSLLFIISLSALCLQNLNFHASQECISTSPAIAYADITVGNETLHGYEPDEIVSTDVNINASTPEEVPAKAENVLISLVKIAIPILAVAAVGLIIYNAIRNLFKKKDERVKMGDVIKNIFVSFFFILFAWIIVEVIIFIVTNGEALVVATIMS